MLIAQLFLEILMGEVKAGEQPESIKQQLSGVNKGNFCECFPTFIWQYINFLLLRMHSK